MEQKVFVICPDKLVNYLVTVLIVNVWHTYTNQSSCGLVLFFIFYFLIGHFFSLLCDGCIDLDCQTIVLIFIVQLRQQHSNHMRHALERERQKE